MSFQHSVFVNCPFDDAYVPLLRPLLFTVCYLGFLPRIALERSDSGEARIEKIVELVAASRLAIHDLSRLRATEAGEFFRLNMPFELGLDVGCRRFGAGDHRSKRCLVLETERYRYQAALSDLAGSDIAVHGNSPEALVREVRNWLAGHGAVRPPGPTAVWDRFNDFTAAHYANLTRQGYSAKDVERQPVSELLAAMRVWIDDARA